MNNCELCKLRARAYCESDQASLCWDCDAKVHAANFLVARHSRTLLCRICNSLTPWKASGEKLGHTVSVCQSCINGQRQQEEENQEPTDGEDDDEEDEDGDVEDDDDEVEEGENQVVPWSTITSTPPPVSSSSSSEDISVFTLKRRREDVPDLHYWDEQNVSSSQREYCSTLKTQAASADSTKPIRSKSVATNAEPRKRVRDQRDKGELSDVDSWGSYSRPI